MRLPSITTLINSGFSPEMSKEIRSAMENFKSQCNPFHTLYPKNTMERINEIIGGFGVEHIPQGHNRKSPEITYVNMGDTYSTTILWVNGSFSVGSWGDIVERGNYD